MIFSQRVRSRRIRLKKHYTLFIEEYFGLLTYAETQSKKLKTEIMSKVGELLAVSRGLNYGNYTLRTEGRRIKLLFWKSGAVSGGSIFRSVLC